MGYFTLAVLALLLVVLLLWLLGSKSPEDRAEADTLAPTATDAPPPSSGTADPLAHSEEAKPVSSLSPAPTSPVLQAPVVNGSGDQLASGVKTKRITIQGPTAGEVVAPPTRDVTPSYQFSPLHQRQPLKREPGLPLPPKPKREPLPKIFRHVVVEGPTELVLKVDKSRQVTVSLAHVDAPDADRVCWLDGRQAPCVALARTALRRYLRQRAVSCRWIDTPDATDGEETQSHDASCYLGTGLSRRNSVPKKGPIHDIASWLARYGWVIPRDEHYDRENRSAQKNALGIYATKGSASDDAVQARKREWQALSSILNEATRDIDAPEAPSDLYGDDDVVGALTLIAPRENTELKPSSPNSLEPPGSQGRQQP
ncbi:hypothetical protein SAMN04515647_2144 [Cohaesibacter sp. ES.047]|uniref:hypothetical protein n=1 Tax=Cohaesibacter sp. ES.047 TaxID=1798205 RepID=UPI000BC0E1E1|nr:hypothetical protein [Cohaesibacter sp. ES.047]SNY91901.1 hypothetical protein SAMN04515647_2144 [Cohaesibacter sp. ES.047]